MPFGGLRGTPNLHATHVRPLSKWSCLPFLCVAVVLHLWLCLGLDLGIRDSGIPLFRGIFGSIWGSEFRCRVVGVWGSGGWFGV